MLVDLASAALFPRRVGHVIYPASGVGATVLVGARSLVDFGLQIPAIAATYALIMGTAVTQSWRRAGLPGSD